MLPLLLRPTAAGRPDRQSAGWLGSAANFERQADDGPKLVGRVGEAIATWEREASLIAIQTSLR